MTQPATISIVDDDDYVRLALQSFLRSAGHDVLVFDRAEAFLASLETNVPHCLITDLHMPGMGGLALQEELGRSGHSFPVIVMTAFPTVEAEERAAKLGASAFLSKPIDCDQLLQLVELNVGASDGRQSD